jgi:hypothetical protein
VATETEPAADFDGCSRECRKAGGHTLKWGRCEFGVEPEPRVDILRVITADDGYPSIVTESTSVSDMAERIEKVLRAVPIRLGPNALAILGRGEKVTLSGSEYSEMALAIARNLAASPNDAMRS